MSTVEEGDPPTLTLVCSNSARITQGNGWTDSKREPSQPYKKVAILFVLQMCAYWKLRAGLEEPRVIPGPQAQMWVCQRAEGGWLSQMEALLCVYLLKNHCSSTGGHALQGCAGKYPAKLQM